MDTRGQHLLLDVWLKEDLNDRHVENITRCIRRNFHVIEEVRHSFDSGAVTLVYILTESHFTVHTYPEHQYISMDLYICNLGINMDLIKDQLLSSMSVWKVRDRLLSRGEYEGISRPTDCLIL